MSLPDSSGIENALVAKLGADATLLGYCPNGVYYGVAPQGATRFVIVDLVDEQDEAIFGGRKFEDALFLVKAVMLNTAGGNIQAAAARIDALLEDSTLSASGYTTQAMFRESRVRYTEVDDVDPSIRWFHRGGRYRVQMTIT